MAKKKINKEFETLKKKLQKSYSLNYVDYSDSLEPESLEEILQSKHSYDAFSEEYDDNLSEERTDNAHREMEETFPDIEVGTEMYDNLIDVIYSRDDSDVLMDLVKNMGREYFYYSLGLKIPALTNRNVKNDIKNNLKLITKFLGTTDIKCVGIETKLKTMVEQSYDGGELVILFESNPKDILTQKIKFENKKGVAITFENPNICIMNRQNGSGDFVELTGLTLTVRFVYQNLHSDVGATGYSYTKDVCGLTKGFMVTKVTIDKKFKLEKKFNKKMIEVKLDEDTIAFAKRERQYQKTYDNGKCSAGDMKYDRHRNIEYINNFPCGNKCKDCGTFWID